MQKWARMLVETGKAFVNPSAMMTKNERGLRLLEFAILTILYWQTVLAITKHPEDGPGIAQINKPTTRLITFL